MADGKEIVVAETEQQGGDQPFLLESFSTRFIPLCVRRQILNEMVMVLPETTKNRLKALRQLQYESTQMEAEFYKEMYALECKYQDMYNVLHDKRSEIISGIHEPTENECKYDLGEIEVDETVTDSKIYELARSKMFVCAPHTEDTRGIPDFWLQTFRNVYMLSDLIQAHDEPAFRTLRDLRVEYSKEPMGFVLEFHFDKNEYFSNSVLTKEYFMKCVPEEDDPFSFDGPEIIKCKGCTIDWYPGKNLTVRTLPDGIYTAEGEQQECIISFFNFFSPPDPPIEGQDQEEEIMRRLTYDYEIAHYIRERIIPRAVLYFTGEGIESEDSDSDDSEDDETEAYEEDDGVPSRST